MSCDHLFTLLQTLKGPVCNFSLLSESLTSSTEDSLEAFMTAVKSEVAMDAVERRKLHVHMADLRKDAQRLRKLVELTRPAQMPSLLPGSDKAAVFNLKVIL